MKLDELFKATRFLIPILIASLLISCSASQHAGVTNIEQPPLTENNESAWFSYYQDQFDAYEGNVLPPTEQYPQAARQAYQRAKADWDAKVEEARGKARLAYIGGSIVFGVVFYLIVSSISSSGTK